MPRRTPPTVLPLPELVTLDPPAGHRLVSAVDVGAIGGVAAERAVSALWDAVRHIGPINVVVTVPQARQRYAYTWLGRWEGIDARHAMSLLVRTDDGPPRGVPVAAVGSLAVYVPVVSDATGEPRG